MRALLLTSGGIDSVTLAYHLAEKQKLHGLVSFDYGQKHRKELDCARQCACRLGVPHDIINITDIGGHLTSALTNAGPEIPDGHYAEETMRSTVVPNRNAIMLSVAFGLAVAKGADAVAAAFHGGDHFIYPDCRPAFVDFFEHMERAALDGMADVKLHAPFLRRTKADIVREAARLKVPFADTWSCYKGGQTHCGRCGTCVERREAFHLAAIADPTSYDDPDYWMQAVAEHRIKGQ